MDCIQLLKQYDTGSVSQTISYTQLPFVSAVHVDRSSDIGSPFFHLGRGKLTLEAQSIVNICSESDRTPTAPASSKPLLEVSVTVDITASSLIDTLSDRCQDNFHLLHVLPPVLQIVLENA